MGWSADDGGSCSRCRVNDYHYCPFCLMPLAILKTDKKGRPYSFCESCGSRLFLKSERGYKGYVRLAQQAGAESGPRLAEILKQGLVSTQGGLNGVPVAQPAAVAVEQPAAAK